MSLAKQAQDLDGFSVGTETDFSFIDDEPLMNTEGDIEMPADSNDLAMMPELEVGPRLFEFALDMVPGGEDQTDIEPLIEVSNGDSVEVESDPWAWKVSDFLAWLQNMMCTIPKHSGKDSAGLERAMAYLEALDKEISKAVRSDLKNQIAIDAVENAREEIHKGLDRLHDRFDKVMTSRYPKRKGKKKKGEVENGIVKEGTSARINGITVTVPLLISGIARTCINSMVSGGKDIEDVFDKLAKKFELSPREEFETFQLLSDMGYSLRLPRGYHRDEKVDSTSPDNFDWGQQFFG